MPFVALLAWLIVIVAASMGTLHLWTSASKSRIVVILLAPGIIAHEMCHVLACLVTGSTVKEVGLTDAGAAGKVVHTPPAIPVLGQALIALAPIVGCGAGLWLATIGLLAAVSGRFAIAAAVPDNLDFLRPDLFAKYLVDVLADTWRAFLRADYRDWRTYLYLFLAANLVSHMSPSKRDWRNGLLSIVTVCLVVFVVDQVWPGLAARPIYRAWPFLTLCLALALSVLVLTLLVIGVIRLIRLMLRPAR